MPELPEVEVIRLSLHNRLLEQQITGVCVRQNQLRWPVDTSIVDYLNNNYVTNTARRGKYLLLEISKNIASASCEAKSSKHFYKQYFKSGYLIFHFGMSGSLCFINPNKIAEKHDHIDIYFKSFALRYRDPRRFGAVLWHPTTCGPIEENRLLINIGVEPLTNDFSSDKGGHHLYLSSRISRSTIKQFLLSGRAVAGLGNIYTAEALFHAKIHPETIVNSISLASYKNLAKAIRATLIKAIAKGGSSLRDFVASNGDKGHFQLDCMVYGRLNQPCKICGTKILQKFIAKRSSAFCPQCQT